MQLCKQFKFNCRYDKKKFITLTLVTIYLSLYLEKFSLDIEYLILNLIDIEKLTTNNVTEIIFYNNI